MSPEERHLWYDFLKRLPFNVHRQHNIGNYIVDFYIAEKNVVIEIDGAQHYTSEHRESDKQRDLVLSAWNITVLRYSNKEIRDSFTSVEKEMLRKLDLQFSDLKPLRERLIRHP